MLHGASQRAGGGEVRVSARRTQQFAQIEALDDGIGPGQSKHRGNGTAMVDFAARFKLLCGAEGRLESGPAPGAGYRVQVTLPARELPS